MTQHPPLYYGLLAGAATLVPGFDERSFVTQVGLLRLFSAALLLPLGAPPSAALPAGVVALVLSLRTPAARPGVARVAVPRQAVDPTRRTPTPAPLIASKEPA